MKKAERYGVSMAKRLCMEALGAAGIGHAIPIGDGTYHLLAPTSVIERLKTVVGPAVTADVTQKLGFNLTEVSSPGSVLVVAGHRSSKVVWGGGDSANVGQFGGIIGVIVDGAMCDAAGATDSNQCKIPTWWSGKLNCASIPHTLETPLNVRVEVFSGDEAGRKWITVNPGDMIAASGEGILVIPKRDFQLAVEIAVFAEAICRLVYGEQKKGVKLSEIPGYKDRFWRRKDVGFKLCDAWLHYYHWVWIHGSASLKQSLKAIVEEDADFKDALPELTRPERICKRLGVETGK